MANTPQVEILDEGGHLAVVVNYGYGWQLSATYPTGRGAQYQEARDRGMAEARAKAEARKAYILKPYGDPTDFAAGPALLHAPDGVVWDE